MLFLYSFFHAPKNRVSGDTKISADEPIRGDFYRLNNRCLSMNNVNNYPDRSIDESNFNPVDGGGNPICDLTEIFEKTTLETSGGASISEKKITKSNGEAQKLADEKMNSIFFLGLPFSGHASFQEPIGLIQWGKEDINRSIENRSIEYHELAAKRLKRLADQGDFEAKKELGDVYSGLGSIHLEKKEDIDKAIEYYELAARCFESLAEQGDLWVKQKLQAVYFNIGYIHVEKKRDIDKGIEYCNLAPDHFKLLADQEDLEVREDFGAIYLILADNYLEEKEDIDKAIEYYELVARFFKPLADQGDPVVNQRLGDVYFKIGSIYLQKRGDADGAIKYYELVAECYSEAADAYLENGDKKKAAVCLPLAAYYHGEAAETYREIGDVYSRIGSIYLKKGGDMDGAIKYYELAAECYIKKAADAYLKNGDKKEAAECFGLAACCHGEAAHANEKNGDKKEAPSLSV